jgi:hypothetical protein
VFSGQPMSTTIEVSNLLTISKAKAICTRTINTVMSIYHVYCNRKNTKFWEVMHQPQIRDSKVEFCLLKTSYVSTSFQSSFNSLIKGCNITLTKRCEAIGREPDSNIPWYNDKVSIKRAGAFQTSPFEGCTISSSFSETPLCHRMCTTVFLDRNNYFTRVVSGKWRSCLCATSVITLSPSSFTTSTNLDCSHFRHCFLFHVLLH